MAIHSALLQSISGIRHGFGTRAEPLSLNAEPNPPKWKQVHGVAVAQVAAPGQACGDVDALWTRAEGLPIAVVTADCVPILLAKKDGSAVAAIHAGWRGTEAKIVFSLWENLGQRLGPNPGQSPSVERESPKNWVAAIGPCIQSCCYEVSAELAASFHRAYPAAHIPDVPERHIDLGRINELQLRELGMESIDRLPLCTRCARDEKGEFLFHSYRREGGGTRQYSRIEIIPRA